MLRKGLLCGNLFEGLLEKFPEGGHRGDESTFGGGMGALHSRTEGHHVEVGIFAQDDGALQSGMIYLDDAVLAVQFLVYFQ